MAFLPWQTPLREMSANDSEKELNYTSDVFWDLMDYIKKSEGLPYILLLPGPMPMTCIQNRLRKKYKEKLKLTLVEEFDVDIDLPMALLLWQTPPRKMSANDSEKKLNYTSDVFWDLMDYVRYVSMTNHKE
ncbi:hypothetical protein CDAR_373971 [Caerostris darwini]|uniref:Uncharacterized protein n=1 Tax=Caerostris darwini TaxID=1538125 RepID=A0AAV4PP62_9ARAC|nr:hypothetical protein CDAR_373971 [Caerostris darwini]